MKKSYRGLTKKQYKRIHGSSTKGSEKQDNCKASGLEKAMIKYPRSIKTNPVLFAAVYEKKDRVAGRTGTMATVN
jgi:hypothetical protein